MEQVGDKIYRLRKEKGLSQEDLGFEIGVSRQAISKWEANTMQPNLENIKALSTIFNVNIDYFLGNTCTDDSINKEVAITSQVSVDKNSNKKKIFIALSVILGIVIVGLIFVIVMVGHSVFTPNTGAFQVKTTNMHLPLFIILCLAFAIVLVCEIILLFKLLHKK